MERQDGNAVKENLSPITDSNQESQSAQLVDMSSPAGAEETCSKRTEGTLCIETHEHHYTRPEGSNSAQLTCDYVHGDGRVCGLVMTIGLHVMDAFGVYAYEVGS